MPLRIIPRLDIKGPNLVKGIHLEGLRVLGKPERFARHYYEAGADELLYMDTVASLYGRNGLLDLVTRTAREVFIPLTVGGGIRSLNDVRAALNAGADKVSMNTAAIARPELIEEAAKQFGSSTIVVSVEAIRRANGTYEAYIQNGRGPTGRDAIEWAQEAAARGAGELLVTAIHQEGTGRGFDHKLINAISSKIAIPVIASGGAGKISDVSDAVELGRADAVCLASILHYQSVATLACKDDDYSREGNTYFLNARPRFSRVEGAQLGDIKRHLRNRGHQCWNLTEAFTPAVGDAA